MSKIYLNCTESDCDVKGGREFFFSDKEQKFYTDRGYTPPKRCWPCREKRRNQKESPFTPILQQMKKHPTEPKKDYNDACARCGGSETVETENVMQRCPDCYREPDDFTGATEGDR